MLHHLKSAELRDGAFSEVSRVLGPGGVFLAFDLPNAWIHRVFHVKSTFVPLDPTAVSSRLTSAGLDHVTVDARSGGFPIRAFGRKSPCSIYLH
jgi:ubiquinone/menaquinone biosynthesis C-methylase UbiE